ncbi:hypothetical protein NPIL_219991, partial [Nephila pilipes]
DGSGSGFQVCVLRNVNFEYYELWMKISGTENRKQSEIVTVTPKEPEMIWYETIDYSQAPRLENNPFAYAYINNPFCGNDFPEMMWYETIDYSQAPRLENNPFAYAYINNPLGGNDY